MFNIKTRKTASAALICLFLAALLVIPVAAQQTVNSSSYNAQVLTTVTTRTRVSGFSQLYQETVNGAVQFVWGVGNTVMPAAYHDGTHYLALMDSGLFLPIEPASPLDRFVFEQGFRWYGPDGIFGTQDDRMFTLEHVMEDLEEGLDDESAAAWNAIGMVIPDWPLIERASMGETSSTTEGNDDSNDNDNDNDTGNDSTNDDNDEDDDALGTSPSSTPGFPQTGFTLTPGAVIAALILSAGAGYVGIAYAKKVKDDKAEDAA
ncbi:MAG: hypothetical protein FWB76_03530 [Oscillospiraceae bacterium]|nr:hypothetical protein [Oscillospiraceae bacterium]